MHIGARRWFAAVLILCAFFVPALLNAAPAPVREAAAERSGGGLVALVRNVLSVLWGENGSIADPDGSALTGDNGSSFDPNGNNINGDNGSIFDPNGQS
jgi:hypothetical protein